MSSDSKDCATFVWVDSAKSLREEQSFALEGSYKQFLEKRD